MCEQIFCRSTLSSTVRMRELGADQSVFPALQFGGREIKTDQNTSFCSFSSEKLSLQLTYCMNVQLDKTKKDPPLSVRLWRKCTIATLNRFYCPRLAPYLVGNIQKKERIRGTRPLDRIKAQVVKADCVFTSVSRVQKESRMYREKLHLFNCKYEKTQV